MDNFQFNLLKAIERSVGANKDLYVPAGEIQNLAKEDKIKPLIPKALKSLTDEGYLENRERSYRITTKGYIYLEAHAISLTLRDELKRDLSDELTKQKDSLKQELNSSIGCNWAVMIVLVVVVLAVVFIYK
ncbi:MAG: hypothetical protein HS100_16055 [Anaerolineales bacterium]|nr:hypothetical protein [Anaerolineales bacterium]